MISDTSVKELTGRDLKIKADPSQGLRESTGDVTTVAHGKSGPHSRIGHSGAWQDDDNA